MTSRALLSGVRVLDMTRILAGPFATMILADMGAEVIKVENPRGGDETRTWGPPFLGPESCYFVSINRNKKSIAVNIKHEKGAEIIKNLAKKCDVLVENYIPGKLDELGFGYNDMKKLNENLIYCSVTGYGSDGPYATRAGYDVIASSIAGLNHITGPEDGDPSRPGVAMTDMSTGLYAHGAILAALWNREKTGQGQKIECDLLSTQISMISHIGANYLNAGIEAKRWGTGHGNIVPYQAFKTKDGRFLTIGAGNNRHFGVLCNLLKLDHLVNDEKYTDNSNRVVNRRELVAILKEKFITKTCDEWLDLLDNCGFPYGPINTIEQAFSDPQVIHNGMIQEIDHSAVPGGKIRVPGPAVHYSDPQCTKPTPPPVLGEHTRQVLSDLIEMPNAEINQLVSIGVLVDGG